MMTHTRTQAHKQPPRRGLVAVAVAAFLFATAPVLPGATWYVTPEGAGLANGTSWANAFSNVQAAVNQVVGAGDRIHLKAGTYALTNALSITGKPDFTLAGGYVGGIDPEALSDEPTTLKPANVGSRVVTAANSTFTLARLTVADGNVTGDGGGLHLSGCQVTVTNVVIRDNVAKCVTTTGELGRGGGIHAVSGSLRLVASTILRNRLVRNGSWSAMHGGGMYCENVTVVIESSQFRENGIDDGDARMTNYGSYGYGGGVKLSGGTADIAGSLFDENYARNARARHGWAYGGAIFADDVARLAIRATQFTRNGCWGDTPWPDNGSAQTAPIQQGGTLYLKGTGLAASLVDCRFTRNAGVIGGGGVGDLRIAAGSVSMTNCLVALNALGGILVDGGAVTIASSTIADNTGWGARRTGGTLALRDSIVRGNLSGGIDGSALVTYCCTQENWVGGGNQQADPLFVGDYYLSVSGLPGQTVDSPCLSAGSGSAADLGLSGLTTRTDGATDGGTVDLGYHYAGAFAGDMRNLALFVDAENGDDDNTGRAPGAGNAFQTIGRALAAAVRGTIITLATGVYDPASGEGFPLTVDVAHLTLQGAGAAATVIDAAGAGQRVVHAVAPGCFQLSDLSLLNGYLNVTALDRTGLRGAGVNAINGVVKLTDCRIAGNAINATISVNAIGNYLGGAGIYVTGGALTLENTEVSGNSITRSGGQYANFFGGGIYAENVALTATGCTFASNRLDSVMSGNYDWNMHGAAIKLKDASASLSACVFTDNVINMPHTRFREGFGAALCAERSRPVCVTESRFLGNWAGPLKVSTDTRYALRGGTVFFFNGTEGVLDRCEVLQGQTALYEDDHGGIEIEYIGGGSGAWASSALRMTNCLVAANADNGVAVRGAKARMEVINCTVVNNSAWGAMNHTVGALQTIHNSIVWENATGGISTNAGDVVTYTLAQESHPGEGDQVADPLFVAPAGGDYRLRDNSPALDAGLAADWMDGARDLGGLPRIQCGGVDLGAYELPPPASTLLMVR